MKMRSQYIPEEARSTIMNFFRIPLNLFVCVVLYIVNAFPITVMFGMCSIFLFMAAILLHMQGRNLLIDMFLYYHNYLARAVAQPWCSTSERTHFSVARLPGTPCVEEFTPKNCEMLCNNTKLDLATVETDVDEKVEDKVCSYVDQLLAAMRAKDSTMHVMLYVDMKVNGVHLKGYKNNFMCTFGVFQVVLGTRKRKEPDVEKQKEPILEHVTVLLASHYHLKFTTRDVFLPFDLFEASLLNTTNQACGLYNEAERLQKMIKKSKDLDAIGEMKSRVTWIDKQLKSHPPKNVESEILREHIKKEREAAKAGKRPYYLKKPELRERKLMNKYNELKVKSTRFTGSFF
ncbi:Tetratricopeptide repeat (TPR)-like superfamily protein [Zea mays]|uniref:rRNA biogenesis protein RRP36 n=1 Tax=Zea mays TaxID=4577 RepID=A0A1D6KSX6_MAIZE|nr:Tetratricopeptide repeat (TPR)-like superfamily protein [Zea mays]